MVAATREPDAVNRVLLSVTAHAQRTLDQQGVRTISDLQARAPPLQVAQQSGSGVQKDHDASVRGQPRPTSWQSQRQLFLTPGG